MANNKRPSEERTLNARSRTSAISGATGLLNGVKGIAEEAKPRLFDNSIVSTPQEAVDFKSRWTLGSFGKS